MDVDVQKVDILGKLEDEHKKNIEKLVVKYGEEKSGEICALYQVLRYSIEPEATIWLHLPSVLFGVANRRLYEEYGPHKKKRRYKSVDIN